MDEPRRLVVRHLAQLHPEAIFAAFKAELQQQGVGGVLFEAGNDDAHGPAASLAEGEGEQEPGDVRGRRDEGTEVDRIPPRRSGRGSL